MAQIILDSNNNLIQGDFDNATLNNRTKLQTTTTNATTNVYVVPNGSSTSAGVSVANNSNLTNASKIVMATNGTTDTQIISGVNGSGTYLPMSFYTNNALAGQFTTAGNLTVTGSVAGATGTLYPIVSGTAVASTSGTSIDFTSIPSWVKRITVMLNGVSTNGTSNILVRLGNSGGIVSSGYVSQASIFSVGARSTTGFILTQEMTSSGLLYGQYICNLQNSATNAWTGCGVLDKNDNNHPFSGGALTSMASALTTVRITTVNGTDAFDAGSINILYE